MHVYLHGCKHIPFCFKAYQTHEMLNVDTYLPLKQWHIRPSLSIIDISVDVPWDYDKKLW
jgi:hypothetical protein